MRGRVVSASVLSGVTVAALTLGACGARTDLDLPLEQAARIREDAEGGHDAQPDVFDARVPFHADADVADASPPDSGNPCRNSVLLVDTVSTAPSGLVAGLQAASPFCAIGYYDANSGTPTLEFIQKFQAVMIFNENALPYDDPVGLGNVLASYFDGGGRVVTALFADGGYLVQGAFGAQYLLIAPIFVPQASDSYVSTVPTEDLLPTSPVLRGVKSITGDGWHGSQGTQNGGIAIARWASGELLAVTGTVVDSQGHKRNRVDLNIQPTDVASGAWQGDGFALLANALLYQ
jgi:hypothetical protein